MHAIGGVVLRRCLTAGVLGIALLKPVWRGITGVETLPATCRRLIRCPPGAQRAAWRRPAALSASPRATGPRGRNILTCSVRLTPEEFEAAPTALGERRFTTMTDGNCPRSKSSLCRGASLRPSGAAFRLAGAAPATSARPGAAGRRRGHCRGPTSTWVERHPGAA